MNEDEALRMVWIVGALALAMSALFFRRLSFWALVRGLLGWAAIGIGVYFAVLHRAEIQALAARVADALGVGDQEVVGDTVRIQQATDGHFWATASINGVPRRMLIDSGATVTALSEDTAAAAGVEVADGAFPVLLTTANGTIAARRAKVNRLELGSLATEDLPVVVSPNFGDFDVLGMNFLSRLGSWRVEGATLILEPKRDEHGN